jgi:hypothetical protein
VNDLTKNWMDMGWDASPVPLKITILEGLIPQVLIGIEVTMCGNLHPHYDGNIKLWLM